MADTKGNLLTCMLLHDDEKEAADMDAGETREIFEICDFQKEWVVCGQWLEKRERNFHGA